jgi:hypothetical protein
VVTASDDETARVWDVSVAVPVGSALLAQFDQFTANARLGSGGFIEILPEWTALRDNLKQRAQAAAATDPSQRWIAWFLADPLHRTTSPFSRQTVADWISNRLEENTPDGIRAVWEIDPNNARCLARLAPIVMSDIPEPYRAAATPLYIELYSRRAAELGPGDAEVLWRRVVALAWLQHRDQAAPMADRCPLPAAQDLWAWEARWEACRTLHRDSAAQLSLETARELAKTRRKFVRDSLDQRVKDFESQAPPSAATQAATMPGQH